MNSEYIEGAKARANKLEPNILASIDWLNGYEHMHDLLVPIEQRIILATFEYKTVAEARIRELEGEFRDRGNAGNTAVSTAEPAFPSERTA